MDVFESARIAGHLEGGSGRVSAGVAPVVFTSGARVSGGFLGEASVRSRTAATLTFMPDMHASRERARARQSRPFRSSFGITRIAQLVFIFSIVCLRLQGGDTRKGPRSNAHKRAQGSGAASNS